MKLLERIEAIWNLQAKAREHLSYIEAISRAHAKFPEQVESFGILDSMFDCNAQLALLKTAHICDRSSESVSIQSTCQYAQANYREFTRYFDTHPGQQKLKTTAELHNLSAKWIGWVSSNETITKVRHIRDWTLAHTDKKAITKPETLPNIPFDQLREVLDCISEFTNEFVSYIEDRTLESGEQLMRPQIIHEVNRAVAGNIVIEEVIMAEITLPGAQPKRPTQARLLEVLRILAKD